ncbi:MAG: MFS transporter [Thermomicrobium sp.]|nr:MFS transporter [Thermomicrobium sp.]
MPSLETAEPKPDVSLSPGPLLGHRPFLVLWLVQTLSQTSQNAVNFGLLVLVQGVIERAGTFPVNTAVGLAVLSFSVPAVLVSPLSGVVADRFDRRTLLILTNFLRGAAVIGLLFVEARWNPLVALAVIYLLAFASGTVGQFFGPALWSMLPSVVPNGRLVQANALFNLTFTASQLAGFAVVGPLLVKLVGVQSVLAGTVVLFALGGLLSVALPRAQRNGHDGSAGARDVARQVLREMLDGLRLAGGQRLLRKAIAYLAVATATYLVIAALGPGYVTQVLDLAKEDIAYLVLPAGIGVVLGTLTVDPITRRVGIERTADLALAVGGVLLVALAGLPELFGTSRSELAAAVVLAALLGMADGLVRAPAQALLQQEAPEEARGRVFAVFFTVSNSVAFLPVFGAGALADAFGVTTVLFGLGALLAVAGIWQISARRRRARPAGAGGRAPDGAVPPRSRD